MKIPLINSKGNLTRFTRIIIFAKLSVWYPATNNPNNDPKIAINPIPTNNKNAKNTELNVIENDNIMVIVIIVVIISEYSVEANIIPNKFSFKDMGETSILSRDFSRVSIGNITGLIAVAVKKEVIATIPINTTSKETSLPIIHESVIKKGNSKPNINTGPCLI
jgi:hypothetical protein